MSATSARTTSAAVVRAVATLTQMLVDRGESAAGLEALSDAEVADRAHASTTPAFDAGDRTVVFLLGRNGCKKAEIVKAEAAVPAERRADAIVVATELPNTVQSGILRQTFGPDAEVFELRALGFNIARHVLVPRHEIVPASQFPALAERLMISGKHQLPSIESSDPMARYIRARPGDVVRITRLCPTAGTQIAFRHCVRR